MSSEAMAGVEHWLSERRQIWEGRFDRLGALLEASEAPAAEPTPQEHQEIAMSKVTPVCHGTFTLNRSWAAPPSRVFSAWSDPHLKRQWFGPPPGEWTEFRRTVEFRPGGIEIHEGKFSQRHDDAV
jgi:hypothetical protein